MNKYKIIITPVSNNEPLSTVVLDVSASNVAVNYPKDTGIEVNSLDVQSHSELCVKMPNDDKEFHIWYADRDGKQRIKPE